MSDVLNTSLQELEDALDSIPQTSASSAGEQVFAIICEAVDYCRKYETQGDEEDLRVATTLARFASGLAARYDAKSTFLLSETGTILGLAFRTFGDPSYLDEAISSSKEALALLSPGDRNEAVVLFSLGSNLELRFEIHEDRTDLDEAIEMGTQASQVLPGTHPNQPGILSTLALWRKTRFLKFGQVSDIEYAFSLCKVAIQLAKMHGVSPSSHLFNYVTCLIAKYNSSKQEEDLETATLAIREAQIYIAPSSPQRAEVLEMVGCVFTARFARSERAEELDEAIASFLEAIALATNQAAVRARAIDACIGLLKSRYSRMSNIQDIEIAIALTKQSFITSPLSDGEKATKLEELDRLLDIRFEDLGEVSDLDQSIAAIERAEELAPSDKHSNTLGQRLFARYQRVEDMTDLQRSLAISEKLCGDKLSEGLDKCDILDDYANRLEARFDRFGQLRDLEKSIDLSQQAVELAQQGPHRVAPLANLASKLFTLAQRHAQADILEQAIEKSREAVRLASDRPHIESQCLNGLALSLYYRYERTGQLSDLDEAINIIRRATTESEQTDPRRKAGRLNNLGIYLRDRYQRLGQGRDLDEAIIVTQRALGLPDQNKTAPLTSLGLMMEDRYDLVGDTEDLTQAIKYTKQSLDLTPIDDPQRSKRLNNLAKHLGARFKSSGNDADLEEGIEYCRQAIASTPVDDPTRALRQTNLALWLRTRFMARQDSKDVDEAIAILKTAWSAKQSEPFQRVKTGMLLLHLLKTFEQYTEALLLARQIIEVLPQVSTRALDYSDQLYAIAQFSGLGSDACCLELLSEEGSPEDRAEQALLTLETARGTINGHIMDSRIDLTNLQASHPEEASRFTALREALNKKPHQSSISDAEVDTASPAESRFRVLDRFNSCIEGIRALPGFEDFLRSLSIDRLKQIPSEGVVVYVNVSSIKSHAIIVGNDGIRSESLPDLDYERINKYVTGRLGYTEKQMRKFLKWLWDVCVKPVFEALAMKPQAGTPTARIHWIGTGAASVIPFHAAGTHSTNNSSENTLAYVISSYIPSIRALAHAQSRASDGQVQHKLLVASMDETPGLASLPATLVECRQIKDRVSRHIDVTYLQQPSASDVLKDLQSHSLFHYAGHGEVDRTDAAKSRLIFKSADSSEQDPLLIQRISDADIKPATLAFLSACSTADSRVATLADENLHLASAFLMAGFSNVVASQWPVQDDVCPQVADEFYKQLDFRKDKKLQVGEVAQALHKAVLSVRELMPASPLAWAPYIHVGV